MSGHSKWHNIQARKGKQDAVKANIFTKLAKGITIAAQRGGDPATNFSLRLAIDKAKAASMPKDNIERAIKRGSGEEEGVHMDEIVYEAFCPGGAAMMIKTITDNRNRTFPELKHIMSKHDGSMAGEGSVRWMFSYVGSIHLSLASVSNRDSMELAVIEAGADDVTVQDDTLVVIVKPERFQAMIAECKKNGFTIESAELVWIAKESIVVPEEARPALEALCAELDEHDDVEDYFINAA